MEHLHNGGCYKQTNIHLRNKRKLALFNSFELFSEIKFTMSEWVAVCADENEEPVEIPTESDGKKSENLGPGGFCFVFTFYLHPNLRLPAVDISDRPVSWIDWAEVQEPRDQHPQGG